MGGLTSSTFLSLFLVPVMFMFFAVRGTPDGAGGRLVVKGPPVALEGVRASPPEGAS